MAERRPPRLRTVDRVKPPYPLNQFPAQFADRLAEHVVYHIAVSSGDDIEGRIWERIFASCVGAKWTPSNVGLDDIRLAPCAWGAKSVKGDPRSAKRIRLISGRNSPVYSFGEERVAGPEVDPNALGAQILSIWNERVAAVRAKFPHLRTVVLIKGRDLLRLGVFETETLLYDPGRYVWQWNKRENLEGRDRQSNEHRFTWQPHGSQFTIIEPVPADLLIIDLQRPRPLVPKDVLRAIGFDRSRVKVSRRRSR